MKYINIFNKILTFFLIYKKTIISFMIDKRKIIFHDFSRAQIYEPINYLL
jgi:hypothetical protein